MQYNVKNWGNVKMNLTKKGDIVRSFLGVLLIFAGIGGLSLNMIMSGIIIILLGISLMPIFYEKTGLKDMKKLQVIVPILFAIIFMISVQGENIDNEVAKTDIVNSNQIETGTNVENLNQADLNQTYSNDQGKQNEVENNTKFAEAENTNENEEINKDTSKESASSKSNVNSTSSSNSSNASTTNKETSNSSNTSKNTSSASSSNNKNTGPVSDSGNGKTSGSSSNKGGTTSNKNNTSSTTNSNKTDGQTVYVTPTGKRYHLISTCGGKNSRPVSLSQAKSMNLTPCKKCAQ